ncbi:MAG: cupredoxin domain-containing protein [Actinobacteria bacterium]|nr:cupredoxin domain-containing protein [Actinomycetota bacterium]
MRTTLALALLALLAAACGGGAETADTSAPAAGNASDDVTRCASFDPHCDEELAPDTVELRGIQFSPPRLEVSAGTTVTFANLDPVPHTVTAGTPDAPVAATFDEDLAADETVTITFDEAGEVAYFCVVHPGAMQATIVVS